MISEDAKIERLKLRGYVCTACDYPCRENVPCLVCALREENERLKAPVTDEEWRDFSFQVECDQIGRLMADRQVIDDLLTARVERKGDAK